MELSNITQKEQVVSLKTDVSACYEHVSSFQLGLNLVNWGSFKAVAVAQDGHTPLFGPDRNSVELHTFWFCLECHTHTAQVKLEGQTEFIQQWLLKVGLSSLAVS